VRDVPGVTVSMAFRAGTPGRPIIAFVSALPMSCQTCGASTAERPIVARDRPGFTGSSASPSP
jgi:hypothetical protein